MRAGELMIGDYVIRKNVPKEILIVDTIDSIRGIVYLDLDGLGITEKIENIEPIPVTPEILEKNGFASNKRVYPYPYYEYINEEDKLKIGFAFPQGNRTSYKEPWVYIDSERVFVEHLPCIYVHELQHVLRLCKINKNIEI